MTDQAPDFAADLLRGAEEIALFLFAERNQRRRVYHLASTSNIPLFKLGSMLCGRRSVLTAWVEQQERRHANDNNELSGKIVPRGKV